MEPGSTYPANFESLRAFFEVVGNERYFKIQIVTLESLDTFEAALRERKVVYKKCFSSMIEESEDLVLILEDSKIYLPSPGKYVLFGNRRHRDFVQIVFSPTLEEKLAAVGDKYTVQAYSYKNINELRRISQGEEWTIESYFGSGLDYFESVIMLVVKNRNKFKDILSGCKEIESKLGNGFFLQMKLNGLVGKLLVVRNGDSYRLNVSKSVLGSIGKRIGFNADSIA
ncbi:uncharacterized protein Eint_041250 [Encephalitozoon intestinalis ATCC 50506]|uniref:Uncharacterized protein n=1 Tax=Encephalitozoon intestinalis (strain ATCC 50506) TaxID=876142 RepID=E0S6S9_ENCIT|nr:uncharacterized protein Eint_041250 [Encephalitozoon intestinalis ATCC 50506]ADM11414.1 hypothetical protein Eint_041250 [Encephalitozoon intestinalis ATCC 50506]UTX45106.1 hypothetical protein GPK93_04g06440 [Encephalitozoon intestinalis]